MKKYIIFILLLGLNSCIKDLELPFEKSEKTIVVNCLFSTDENWNVTLTRIKSFSDKTDSFVSDATVDIVPENNDTIRLHYNGGGSYSAEERPVSGIQYQLLVKEPNSKTITAKSSIPDTLDVSSVKLTNQRTKFFSNPNLSDYDVVPLSLKVSATGQTNFVRFRFYSFNTDLGYKRFFITEQSIQNLRKKELSEDFLLKLSAMVGKKMSHNDFYKQLRKICDEFDGNGQPNYLFLTESEVQETTINYRSTDAFMAGMIFSNSNWLNNVSRDSYNVLGEFSLTANANLFVDFLPVLNKNDRTDYEEEYWLEITGMSEAYYKYQKSYIKQVVNQSNPFSSVVEVYSNIQNGVGIFAGYTRQMIHFYDY